MQIFKNRTFGQFTTLVHCKTVKCGSSGHGVLKKNDSLLSLIKQKFIIATLKLSSLNANSPIEQTDNQTLLSI